MNRVTLKKKKSVVAPKLLRGMKDILPDEQQWFEAIREHVRAFARDFHFDRIDTPILESTSLFVRAVGDETDIVQKEMYSFVDQGGDHISVRPEASASVIRAYIEHGMMSVPQPVKLYYFGPMFRHERPQMGRFRQFYQLGYETIGDAGAVCDAESILLGERLCRSLGIMPRIQLNSIGDENCRPAYEAALKAYFRAHKAKLCEACKRRLNKNPLRILDCKESTCNALAEAAPQSVDNLCDPCKKHFTQVLEYLDELGLAYDLNPKLVRGLDYYTRTVFEYWSTDERFGGQLALGGGGRYDNLAEQLGGRHTPVVGFALGVERLVLLMRELQSYTLPVYEPDVFIAPLGDQARKKALHVFDELRAAGIKVRHSFTKDGLSGQLGMASRYNVAYTLIIGQQELLDETVMVRDMMNNSQEVVGFHKIVDDIRKRLQKRKSALAQNKEDSFGEK